MTGFGLAIRTGAAAAGKLCAELSSQGTQVCGAYCTGHTFASIGDEDRSFSIDVPAIGQTRYQLVRNAGTRMNQTEFIDERPGLLCLSKAADLLELRCRVLSTRYPTISLSTVTEMEALCDRSAFSVLVLCHSLSVEECQTSMYLARCRWPAIKVLALAAPLCCCQGHGADAIIPALEGPLAIFQAIDTLLQEPAILH